MKLSMDRSPQDNIGRLIPQNDFFRLVFENHSAAMLVIDGTNGAIISANRAAENFYGYPPASLTSMNIADINQLPVPTINNKMESALNESLNCFESPHRLAGGEIRTVEVHSANICLDDRDLLFSVIHDITERKQAEQALRESENRYRRITESITDYIFTVRVENGIPVETHHGAGCLAVTGYTEEEFLSDQFLWLRMVPEEDHPLILVQAKRAQNGENVDGVEHRIVRKDGALRWVRNSPVIRRDADGILLSYDGLIQDITERKQAEDKLKKSEQDLKSLLEILPVGVGWSDTNGNIEYVNRNFMELFGYTRHDIPTIHDWFARAYPDPAYRNSLAGIRGNAYSIAQEEGTSIPPMETYVACKDGSFRNVIINTQLTSSRTIEIFTDITERDRIQNEQIKTQKLESLGVLAGGIAHDFNNILTAISGNISFSQMFLDPAHNAYKPLQEAEKASKRAAELALQLLTFAKGGQPIAKTVSSSKIIEESISLVLRGSNVKGVVKIPEDLHPLMVDEGQISQVFNNILINAVQAMPDGGTITVSAENTHIDAGNMRSLSPGEYVKYLFRDEGRGITVEDQKKIFDPYYSTKPGGSGLGLASVHSIVSKHKGQVAVYSELGKGTTFEILLPESKEILLEPAEELKTRVSKPAGCSILVMDDEEMIRDMASAMLSHLGYQITTCANGEEAISLYKLAKDDGKPFSAVIMDLTIPGAMGGKEAAQQILAYDAAAHLMVSSGYSNDPVMANHEEYGFLAAVIKPYKVNDLAHALHRVIQTRELSS